MNEIFCSLRHYVQVSYLVHEQPRAPFTVRQLDNVLLMGHQQLCDLQYCSFLIFQQPRNNSRKQENQDEAKQMELISAVLNAGIRVCFALRHSDQLACSPPHKHMDLAWLFETSLICSNLISWCAARLSVPILFSFICPFITIDSQMIPVRFKRFQALIERTNRMVLSKTMQLNRKCTYQTLKQIYSGGVVINRLIHSYILCVFNNNILVETGNF